MDDNKKPGQRDISDLKARLGLKKNTAAMPAVTPPAAQRSPAQAGAATVAESAGRRPTRADSVAVRRQPRACPAPAAPAAPPDPRRDPFAQQQAANLAAFYGVGQVLPGLATASAPSRSRSRSRGA